MYIGVYDSVHAYVLETWHSKLSNYWNKTERAAAYVAGIFHDPIQRRSCSRLLWSQAQTFWWTEVTA